MIVKTGIFAPEDQLELIKSASSEAQESPMIKVHGIWMHELAHERLMDLIDHYAEKCGLSKPGFIDGSVNHYGILATGEFTRYEKDDND